MPPQSQKASRAGAKKTALERNSPTRKAPTKRGTVPAKRAAGQGAKPSKARSGKAPKAPQEKGPKAPAVAARDGFRSKGPQAAVGRKVDEADHMHQDPRWAPSKLDAKWMKAKRDPRKEGGLSKDRQVRRMQPVTNWYRQAPKPKGTTQ